jgi:hypothetical protein
VDALGRNRLVGPVSILTRHFSSLRARWKRSLPVAQLLGTTAVISLVAAGLALQIEIGRINRDPHSELNQLSAEVDAGRWIRSHTDANTTVTARHVPTLVHYSARKVIWFPPSSNPQLLTEGIVKHRINLVLVVQRAGSAYYRPSDSDCFAPLLKDYPNAFRLIYQVPEFKVYQVASATVPLRNAPMLLPIESSLSRKFLVMEGF